MDWRCVNQPLGYCKGEPDWNAGPDTEPHRKNFSGCKRDPKECPKYLTVTQKYAGMSAPLPNPSHSSTAVKTRKRSRKAK